MRVTIPMAVRRIASSRGKRLTAGNAIRLAARSSDVKRSPLLGEIARSAAIGAPAPAAAERISPVRLRRPDRTSTAARLRGE
ncbi:hypothetical protein M446_1524 [Methylobacterium sp. 4-46]|nr:hypothetical protein M446_1524 [Methylobacterium sp. 4-46]